MAGDGHRILDGDDGDDNFFSFWKKLVDLLQVTKVRQKTSRQAKISVVNK